MCKAQDIGIREGCTVKAITDVMGSHVVVKGNTKHCLHRCDSHKQAVALAKRVVKEGFKVCKWSKPPQTIPDLMFAIAFAQC